MHPKYFSLNEAEALIPELTRLMGEVRELKRRADQKLAVVRAGAVTDPIEKIMAQGQVDFLLSEINQRLEAVCHLGCVPKDLDIGLVDFPTRLGQQEVYFCWCLGETDINHYHSLTEGYQGRKPLQPSIFYRAPR